MPAPPEILRERLRACLDQRGMSPRALSLAIGANHSYVTQIISGKGGSPSADKLMRMAEVLETTVDWLTGSSNGQAQVRSEVGIHDKVLEWRGPTPGAPGIPLVGTGDCADLEVSSDDGSMVKVDRSSFDPDFHVRLIARPPALMGMPGLYAIYFHGDSMVPRFEPGEVGIVDPHRTPAIGDYVLVQLRGDDHDDVESVLVKRLVGRSREQIRLFQFNEPLTFTLPTRLVKRMHRIIAPTDLLF